MSGKIQYVKYEHYDSGAQITLPIELHGLFCCLFERLGFDFVPEPKYEVGAKVWIAEKGSGAPIAEREWYGRDPKCYEVIPSWHYLIEGEDAWIPEENLVGSHGDIFIKEEAPDEAGSTASGNAMTRAAASRL